MEIPRDSCRRFCKERTGIRDMGREMDTVDGGGGGGAGAAAVTGFASDGGVGLASLTLLRSR